MAELIGDEQGNIGNVDTVTKVWQITRSDGQPDYEGSASPGTAKNVTGWQIKKFTYDANGFVTDIQWADGNAKFTKIWDDRAGYTYN
jgi:YD repeat-containing protein